VSGRQAIEAELLAWMRDPDWRDDEARFERLALALFAHQFDQCAPYRRFCQGRDRTPDRVHGWREIPPVPTGAFKELALRSFPAERTIHTFRTSGTSTSKRGELHLDTLELYEASLLASFRRFVLADLPADGRARLLVLAPPASRAPDSSLSHMFDVVMRQLGTPESDCFVADETLEIDRLLDALGAASAGAEPIALCGTAFAFVHLTDEMARRGLSIQLPDCARVMETGGFKGRSRRVGPSELYASIERCMDVPAARIVNQYGMTELGSQFYDSVLRDPGVSRHKPAPPWTRVLIVDPESGTEAGPEDLGSIALFDLANTGSVLALQTADLGRRVEEGFQVEGREPGAEARGCSIAADELLAGATP
jgi:hypothetical protein